MSQKISEHIINELQTEYGYATNEFPPFRSAHEGYAILLEEMEELKAEVLNKDRVISDLRREAEQVAVTAIRFISDLC